MTDPATKAADRPAKPAVDISSEAITARVAYLRDYGLVATADILEALAAADDDIRRLLVARDATIARLSAEADDLRRAADEIERLSATLALTREALDLCLALDPDGARAVMAKIEKGEQP